MIKTLLFEPDKSINQTNYYTFENAFSKEEIMWIDNLSKMYEFKNGETVGNSDDSVRKSKIKWIYHSVESHWLYEKLINMSEEANNALWKFDLRGVIDSIQLSEYEENGGHYDWHVDIGPDPINHRKISMVVQLSDPEDYSGGDLMLWNNQTPSIAPKGIGSVTLFPSFMMHKVSKMEKGERKSLVLWIGGGSYK
jgi:PKHD-type hydroxylase